ncbi:unnamed protein product [Auanema sp. JU1783]|nr:unnamed protein product [Auanema sp. JU1783]
MTSTLSPASFNITSIVNQTEASKSVDSVTIYESAFYFSAGSLGTVFNSLVLFIALKYVNSDDKPRQILVFNMTIADLLFSVVYVLTRPFLNIFPIFLCKPYYIIIWTVQLCSTLNLVWLNLDKLIFIQYPLHYYQLVNRYKVLILSIITWSFLTILAFSVSLFMDASLGCTRVQLDMNIYLPICILYAVMILTSFIISAIIYFVAHTSSKMEERQRSGVYKRLFFLFSSTLWTFFTCLPYRVLYLTNMLCGSCRSSVLNDATNFFFRILVIGTIINPLITIWTQRIYRVSFLKLFGKKKPVNHMLITANVREKDSTTGRACRSKSTV